MQSIRFAKSILAKKMDARVKPGHDGQRAGRLASAK